MEDYEEISIMDVYDIVRDFAKEFRPIIEMYGPDPLNNIMSKIVRILEHLEAQTVKIGRLQSNLQEKDTIIARLEKDKIEKAADRARFEKELEQIEEHWREESQEMVSVVNRLQEENRKLLKALSSKQDLSGNHSHPLSPEVDISVLQKSRTSIDKLRDQLKLKDREVNAKITEIENLSSQIDRSMAINKELRKKNRILQGQVRNLIDERAAFLTQLQDQNHELIELRQNLGIAEKENEDLAQSQADKIILEKKAGLDLDDPNRPRFTTEELKEILRERNEYKARITSLEEELEKYRRNESDVNIEEEVEDTEADDEDDAPVQGPLPYEPNDAPWRKSESRIRKIFRKLFNETNVTILGTSPKRSLSTFSKMTLATASDSDTTL